MLNVPGRSKCIERRDLEGALTVMTYMKAKGIPKFGLAFQKCILGYMSDMTLSVKTQPLIHFW